MPLNSYVISWLQLMYLNINLQIRKCEQASVFVMY